MRSVRVLLSCLVLGAAHLVGFAATSHALPYQADDTTPEKVATYLASALDYEHYSRVRVILAGEALQYFNHGSLREELKSPLLLPGEKYSADSTFLRKGQPVSIPSDSMVLPERTFYRVQLKAVGHSVMRVIFTSEVECANSMALSPVMGADQPAGAAPKAFCRIFRITAGPGK